MYEGRIIKFYREKANLTQEQLGSGVCSTTHVSKIERGLTEYSSEITVLLAEKLSIDMAKEVFSISTIKEKINLWHELIITQSFLASSDTEKELDKNPLIAVSEYKTLFYLIKLLHHIKLGNYNKAQELFKYLPKKANSLSDFEQNLYKHVLGIYYMLIDDHLTSIRFLKDIDFDTYPNPMGYYDLASAYHHNKSPVLAYYYAEKALNLFKQKNNFLGIIDAENLMIIQLESDYHREFNETVEQYENLLSLCDLVHANDKKAKIYHNYAYESLRKQNYDEAKRLYIKSMELKEKNSGVYLLSLEGFIRCEIEHNSLSQQTLLNYIDDGLTIAKKINDTLYSKILSLHKYHVLKQKKKYYNFLANKALPYFKVNGYVMIAQRYEAELFTYYLENNQRDQALKIAIPIVKYLEN